MDRRHFLPALIGDGRPLLSLTGLALLFSGLFAFFLSATGHFLPHDVAYLGMSRDEMDAINPMMPTVDVALVIGANDVVNPAAREDKSSPIHGMPIINVDHAQTVFVLKRSIASGFAGVENPLFFNENTRMVFGDAKQTLQAMVNEFKAT